MKREPTIEFKPREDATEKTYAVLFDGVHVADAVYGDQSKYDGGESKEPEWHLITFGDVQLSDGRKYKHPPIFMLESIMHLMRKKLIDPDKQNKNGV